MRSSEDAAPQPGRRVPYEPSEVPMRPRFAEARDAALCHSGRQLITVSFRSLSRNAVT